MNRIPSTRNPTRTLLTYSSKVFPAAAASSKVGGYLGSKAGILLDLYDTLILIGYTHYTNRYKNVNCNCKQFIFRGVLDVMANCNNFVLGLVAGIGAGVVVGLAIRGGAKEKETSSRDDAPPQNAEEGAIAEADKVPFDLRRTTLVVDDIDISLQFYQDVLGMVTIYDSCIIDPRDAKTIEASTRWRRLVFLRANNSYIGVLGLLQYIKPEQPKSPRVEKPLQNGSVVLLFNYQDDVRQRITQAGKVPGARVIDDATETSYPGYDGKSVIRVIRSMLLDPDGNGVEINQVLGGLR